MFVAEKTLLQQKGNKKEKGILQIKINFTVIQKNSFVD